MSKFTEYYDNLNPEIKKYFKILSPVFPSFLIPFIETTTMMRLKAIGYFCGMDHGNPDYYHFKYYLSTLDHSISTALMVWNMTHDVKKTLAALFHDASSPAFRHAIDYYNKDFKNQESTEIDLEEFLVNDKGLMRLLDTYHISLKDIANYKNIPIIDCKRPRMCADRLDGIFLTSLVWTQKTNLSEIKKLYQNTILVVNEDNEEELSFIDLVDADQIVELNELINEETHSDKDYFSMLYLSDLVGVLINKKIINYKDLYILTDLDVFKIVENNLKDLEVKSKYDRFINLSYNPNEEREPVKVRKIDPFILKIRYSKI